MEIWDDAIDPTVQPLRLKPEVARLLRERTEVIGNNSYLEISPHRNADLIPLLMDPFVEEAPQ